ncbi:MAG: hypothetical protein V8Q01_06470 [Acutalibacteraceae bacterium]
MLTGEVPAQIQQSVSAAEARRAQGRYQVAKIVAGALLVAGSVIGLITEVRLFWVKPFYMFIEIYLLVLAFVLVVVGAMVFLIGLVRYRTEMQHLNTANRIEALAALAGAGPFPSLPYCAPAHPTGHGGIHRAAGGSCGAVGLATGGGLQKTAGRKKPSHRRERLILSKK